MEESQVVMGNLNPGVVVGASHVGQTGSLRSGLLSYPQSIDKRYCIVYLCSEQVIRTAPLKSPSSSLEETRLAKLERGPW